MNESPKKKTPSAKTQGAVQNKHTDYPANLDATVGAAFDAVNLAQQQLRRAGCSLVRGNLPACMSALEASRRAIGAALDSLAGALGSA